MGITLSVIKADIGSIGGHLAPSDELFNTVRRRVHVDGERLLDSYVGFTGDDIAILMSHRRGESDAAVHKLAWDVFVAGTEVARQQGLYGAGQDLLRDSFSGNVRGLEYTGITEKLAALDKRFVARAPRQAAVA
jgi:fructose 1,6-bisphosphate aldolase/phosphatase